MNRSEIRKELDKYGGLLSVTQAAEYLGLSREVTRRDYLNGLDYILQGNKKLYFAKDFAKAIDEKRRK